MVVIGRGWVGDACWYRGLSQSPVWRINQLKVLLQLVTQQAMVYRGTRIHGSRHDMAIDDIYV